VNPRWLLFGIILVTILIPGVNAAIAPGWEGMFVDSAENVGKYTSLALDGSGNPGISYYDSAHGNLIYAKWTGSIWQFQYVDSSGDVGMYTSLKYNQEGHPCISYYDNTSHDLKYAEYVPPGTWTPPYWDIDIVDTVGDVGMYTSLALDGSGNPHISYYDATNGKLKYVSWDDDEDHWGWPEIVGPITGGDWGRYTSLALDGSDNPHISYFDADNQFLKYAYWTGSGWHIETVDDTGYVGEYSSLALDESDNPHISYIDNYPNFDLKYAKYVPPGTWIPPYWDIDVVDSPEYTVRSTSLVLDGSGNPHISYYGASSLKYAKGTITGWENTTVDSDWYVGWYSSLALDGDGNPHISYWDGTNGHLKYAKWTGIRADWIGVFRSGTWYLDYNGDGAWSTGDRTYHFGLSTDIPVSGDWNNDGKTEIGAFRPGNRMWYLDNGDGAWGAGDMILGPFGKATDSPVSGDWDGVGKTEVGVFRSGTWYLDYNGDGTWNAGDRSCSFGKATDIPVSGDWNRDGRTEIGSFRSGSWYLDYNGDGTWNSGDRSCSFGKATDIPVSGDWNRDGTTEIGTFRSGIWYLDYTGDGVWNAGDKTYGFGKATDKPVTGAWL
jgi:hypothetical protein